MTNTVGLALSGGGVRGVAHLGVIKALNELEIKFSRISGTSSGAIVGAFISAGYAPEEILKIAIEKKFFGFSNLLFGKAGLFDMKNFEAVYKTYFPDNNIEDLPIPLTIVATDMVNESIKYFEEGNLSQALMASSCVPLIFQPIQYDETILMDGGILNNFPIEPLQGRVDKIIGVTVNSLSKKLNELHMKDMLDRSFHFTLNKELMTKAALCDVFIEPPGMSRFGMFDMDAFQEVFDYGYTYTKSIEADILLHLK
ncbi:MAG: patatin-like phospholipase family protein [Bacteroidia bacterium]|nr:patatin-like phospholipase family protein [Bacteroidia bacterium]